MLGWVMRRGVENGPTAPRVVAEGDTTQIDQPDTPAPVFAARAIKSALFGTPARPNDDTFAVDMAGETKSDIIDDDPTRTPRLAGILLTPGTGTSRRKRVSFGHDVVDRAGKSINKSSRDASGDLTTKDGRAARKRTKLTEALENSRRNKPQNVVPAPNAAVSDKADMAAEEWVEDDEGGDEDHCTHDITLDLNEPHSRSGKYWKSNFEQYHQDAKIEMEKLLKYKQLAKSYAKMKDAEALDLQEKLKEERQRVAKMERGIQEMKAHVRSKSDAKDDSELKKHLAKQTELAEQYKTQVQELETMLQEHPSESTGRRARLAASPRTQKTLLETKRELRRAREQVREIGELRAEIIHLKSDLSSAQQHMSKLAEENKRLARDCDNDSDAKVFKAQLKDAKEETRRKDNELRRLREEFASFKSEMLAREEESKQALNKARDKIAELKKEVSTLQTSSIARRRPTSYPNSKAAEPIFDDTMSDIEPRIKARARNDRVARELNRQSIDGADLALDTDPRNAETTMARPTLREKYREEPSVKPSDLLQELGVAGTDILMERTDSDRPQQQPSRARTTRASESLKQGSQRRIHSSSDALLGTRARMARDALDLHPIEESRPLSTRTRSAAARSSEADQVRERFGRLGGTDLDNSATMSANTSRSVLPPDRLAAAMARIEQRKQQRKRSHMGVSDKENVRP